MSEVNKNITKNVCDKVYKPKNLISIVYKHLGQLIDKWVRG